MAGPSRAARRAFRAALESCEALARVGRLPNGALTYRPTGISAWSIAEHLDHLALANRAITQGIEGMLAAPDQDEGGDLNLIGRTVLLTGWIPRGKGQAPDFTRPRGALPADLRVELAEIQADVAGLEGRLSTVAAARGRRAHPAFGGLRPLQWLRFVGIHNRHHLKIMRDIQSALPTI